MFDKNNRYISRGANEALNMIQQLLLWNLIDSLEQRKKSDYLQIFQFKRIHWNDKYNLMITHSREVPPYEKTYMLYPENPIDVKVYVIDDVDHSTMILASEY